MVYRPKLCSAYKKLTMPSAKASRENIAKGRQKLSELVKAGKRSLAAVAEEPVTVAADPDLSEEDQTPLESEEEEDEAPQRPETPPPAPKRARAPRKGKKVAEPYPLSEEEEYDEAAPRAKKPNKRQLAQLATQEVVDQIRRSLQEEFVQMKSQLQLQQQEAKMAKATQRVLMEI